MSLNLTPTFERAFSQLQSRGSDDGARVCYGKRGRSFTRHVGRGIHELAASIKTLSCATDRHTTPCGDEFCSGDQILYIAHQTHSTRAGQSRFYSGRRTTTYDFEIRVGTIVSIEVTTGSPSDQITLETPEGEIVTSRAALSMWGAWRMPWNHEQARDGALALLMAQRDLAREDNERCLPV